MYNSCCHINDLINLKDFENIYYALPSCSCCNENKDVNICLLCGKAYCTKKVKNHSLENYNQNKDHCIYINIHKIKVYCYSCNEHGKEINNEETNKYISIIENIKEEEMWNNLLGKLNKLSINKEKKTISEEDIKEGNKIKYDKLINGLKNDTFKNIVFMVGAGISTAAGIPDFRSKGGIFEKLQKQYNLPYPEMVFELDTFYNNPTYFYQFATEFLHENYEPTLFHYFMGFLIYLNKAKFIFTQNIDGLENKAVRDINKIIYAHGNFLKAHCPKCRTNIEFTEYNKRFLKGDYIKCNKCNSPCKYNIVFYGENLDEEFYIKMNEISDCDCAIICGTSLKVGPFNSLPDKVNKDCLRVVIDLYKVAEEAFKYDEKESNDLYIQLKCEEFVKNIIKDCKWEDKFDEYIKETKKQK